MLIAKLNHSENNMIIMIFLNKIYTLKLVLKSQTKEKAYLE